MNLLIVGINPSAKERRKLSTRDRLDTWMEAIGVGEYDFKNVIDEPGEYHINKVDSDRVVSFCKDRYKIIALGNFVSGVLTKLNIEHHKLPHPSPLNRKLNDKSYERECIEKCKVYLNEQDKNSNRGLRLCWEGS